MSPFFDVIRRFVQRVGEFLFGYGTYGPPWRWDRRCQRWVYGPSEGAGTKGYNCTESVIARIEGRPPNYGPDSYATTETEAIVARLQRLGWERRECNCGCGPGQSKDCVVLYVQDGVIFHAAIFDHVHCDWGGKASGTGPIIRYKRAVDYLLYCGETPPRTEMWFFCPRPAGPGVAAGTAPAAGQQKTDEWLHTNASTTTVWLECPSAIQVTIAGTATRAAWQRRTAHAAATAAATAAVNARALGVIAAHKCAGTCTATGNRPGGAVTAAACGGRTVGDFFQKRCTITWSETFTITCR